MRIAVTGAHGFLGWHLRCRLRAFTDHDVIPVTRAEWPELATTVSNVDAVLHVAGINRADDGAAIEHGNAQLARDLADAIAVAPRPPAVVFANSVQAGNDSPYGAGKALSAEILRTACVRAGSAFTNILLPNLFGEHGRPDYNSFVATFVDRIVNGKTIEVQDRQIELLHVQTAAEAMMAALTETEKARLETTASSVEQIQDTLVSFRDLYSRYEIPALTSHFDVALFNTFRAALFPSGSPFVPQPRTDKRGTLVETVRYHGGEGQAFVSTTKPGVTRGQHFHFRKIERFAVIRGQATISMRRLLTNETISFDIDGSRPATIDMPTLWSHNITNTGTDELVTMFWANELFDPDDPDTFPEPVDPGTAP